jgi:hypothetical protein
MDILLYLNTMPLTDLDQLLRPAKKYTHNFPYDIYLVQKYPKADWVQE